MQNYDRTFPELEILFFASNAVGHTHKNTRKHTNFYVRLASIPCSWCLRLSLARMGLLR
jgi:hypothetical protein